MRTLIERWDGQTWSIVQSPDRPRYINELYGVDVAGRELFSVGQSAGSTGFRTLAIKGDCPELLAGIGLAWALQAGVGASGVLGSASL